MRDHTVQSDAHVSKMHLRPLIAYNMLWKIGAIEIPIRFINLHFEESVLLFECGNNRLNTSFV